MSIALYRKYRPTDFETIVGQSQVTNVLKNQIKLGKISHAYIFTGVRGTGKTSTAKVFAKAVSCENYDEEKGPCNECQSCKNYMVDTVEIDAASNNSVDNIRALQETVMYLPSYAKYKVYIIDEAHMLSAGAFNALLKTLEEPPAHVIFILATTELAKIPETIVSRCQKFEFRKIDQDDIYKRLCEILTKENIKFDEQAVRYIANLSNGGLRDAISLVDQVSSLGDVNMDNIAFAIGQVPIKTIDILLSKIIGKDTLGALEILQEQKSAVDLKTIPSLLISRLIDAMHLNAKSTKEVLFTESIKTFSKDIGIEQATDMAVELSELTNRMKLSQNPEILLDAFIVGSTKNIVLSDDSYKSQIEMLKSEISSLRQELEQIKSQGIIVATSENKETKTTVDTNVSSQNKNIQTKSSISPKAVSTQEEISDSEKQLIEQIVSVMPDVQNKLRHDKYPQVAALLLDAKVSRAMNNTIYLTFDDKMTFHKNKLGAPENVLLVKEAINKIAGTNYDVKVIFDHELSGQKTEKVDETLENLRQKFKGVPIDVVDN